MADFDQVSPDSVRAWRRKHTILVLGLLVVLVIAGVTAGSVKLNQPVMGQVTVGSPRQDATDFTVSLQPKQYVGKTASFTYPAGLSPRQPSQLVGPDIEKMAFSARDLETWNLRISVTNDGAQPLTSNSAYSFRKIHSEMYQQSTMTVAGQPTVVMTDTTAAGFSKVAFLRHGDRQATVSLIGDDSQGSAPLQTAFTMVLSSWHWQ